VSALAILTTTAMNDSARSYVDRLPKFIVVYVDGRCRAAECVVGTFYLDSDRPGGPQVETWMEELAAWVDHGFRTMPPVELDVDE
jgi:hypothetical protein